MWANGCNEGELNRTLLKTKNLKAKCVTGIKNPQNGKNCLCAWRVGIKNPPVEEKASCKGPPVPTRERAGCAPEVCYCADGSRRRAQCTRARSGHLSGRKVVSGEPGSFWAYNAQVRRARACTSPACCCATSMRVGPPEGAIGAHLRVKYQVREWCWGKDMNRSCGTPR